jgi:alkanesulfonate monooxygenase SsuD/methylene tetrahydromethanopterin reductase-like flavin-dependent oxidoreductase (luciferase family)
MPEPSLAPPTVGIMLREHHLTGGVEHLRGRVAAIADAGIDHVGVFDHVSFWDGTGFDGLINATALAMAHPTLPVHTGVYLLPLRHPVIVARQLSSLALLAPGRIQFGVGIGGEDRHEIAVWGVRMDECIRVVRDLLDGQRVSFDGEHVQVDEALIRPTPRIPIPIVIGGRSDAALRRTARLGDGWLGFANSPERFAAAVKLIDEEAFERGRAGVDWRHGMVVWCGLDNDRSVARSVLAEEMEALYKLPFERFVRYTPYGTPGDIAERLAPYVDAGCRSFSLIPVSPTLDEAIEATAEVRRLLAR